MGTSLGHPIIVISHHQDCVSNCNQFERWASMINGISKTRWCSVGEIARSNYCPQRSDNKLLVFLYSRCCLLDLPPGTMSLEFKSTAFCAKDVPVSLELLKGKREPVVWRIWHYVEAKTRIESLSQAFLLLSLPTRR
jgi:hypothetical protein